MLTRRTILVGVTSLVALPPESYKALLRNTRATSDLATIYGPEHAELAATAKAALEAEILRGTAAMGVQRSITCPLCDLQIIVKADFSAS